MKDMIAYIVKGIVDHPEKVSITEIEGDQSIVFELEVAKEDIGKVIGKRGQNVSAIRTIMNAASAKIKKRVVLELAVFPDGSARLNRLQTAIKNFNGIISHSRYIFGVKSHN